MVANIHDGQDRFKVTDRVRDGQGAVEVLSLYVNDKQCSLHLITVIERNERMSVNQNTRGARRPGSHPSRLVVGDEAFEACLQKMQRRADEFLRDG